MARTVTGERIRSKTLRWALTDGPTAGATFDHTFHGDGTVEWHSVEDPGKATPARGSADDAERAKYGAVEVTKDVQLVSYLAASGYTLTVALNFDDGHLRGFVSNQKEWFPVAGTFETVTKDQAKQAA